MLSRFRNGVVMAGDAVHWTPEMRRAMSEKMKARRASDSKEQKEARKLKRSETELFARENVPEYFARLAMS